MKFEEQESIDDSSEEIVLEPEIERNWCWWRIKTYVRLR